MTCGSFDDALSVQTEAILQRFNQVFLSHNPEALPELVADDCVIENTQQRRMALAIRARTPASRSGRKSLPTPPSTSSPRASSRAATVARSGGGWSGDRTTRTPCEASI